MRFQIGISKRGQLWATLCLILFGLGTAFRVPLVWILATLLLLPFFAYLYYLKSYLNILEVKIEWQATSTAIRAESILIVFATVENDSSRPRDLRLALNVSRSGFFIDNRPEQLVRVEPGEIAQCTWLLTFVERGKATIGPLYAGIGGMGGFFAFWRQVPGTPLDVTVMARVPRIQLDERAQRRIYGNLVGAFAQQIRGIGTDFHALRDYVPGDERKHISWKATARLGRLIAKEYELDQNLQVMVLQDLGRTMAGMKHEFALTSVIEFGELLEMGHHEFGLVQYSAKIEAFLNPGSGKQHHLRRLQLTAKAETHFEPADLLQAVRFLIGQRFRRSLILVISDLEGDHNHKQMALSELKAQHHVVIYVNLHTPSFARTAEHLRDATTSMDSLRRQFVENVLAPDVSYRYFILERNFRRLLEMIGVHYFKVASPRESYLLEFEKWMRETNVVSREAYLLSARVGGSQK
ncbi:MAG: DUF58 domain-containing protein [Candidatus Heimdallarchaeota archaeon]